MPPYTPDSWERLSAHYASKRPSLRVLGQHVLNEHVLLREGLAAVGAHIGGCVIGHMQPLVPSQLRLLGETLSTLCTLMHCFIRLLSSIQVVSQVPVAIFPLAEALFTKLALKRLLASEGPFLQDETAPFIEVFFPVPVEILPLAEALLTELALKWQLVSAWTFIRAEMAPLLVILPQVFIQHIFLQEQVTTFLAGIDRMQNSGGHFILAFILPCITSRLADQHAVIFNKRSQRPLWQAGLH